MPSPSLSARSKTSGCRRPFAPITGPLRLGARPVRAEQTRRLMAAPRHRPRAHCAGASRAEWPSRTAALDAKDGSHAPRGPQPLATTSRFDAFVQPWHYSGSPRDMIGSFMQQVHFSSGNTQCQYCGETVIVTRLSAHIAKAHPRPVAADMSPKLVRKPTR